MQLLGLTAYGVRLVASVFDVLRHEYLPGRYPVRHVLHKHIWSDTSVRGITARHDRAPCRRAEWLHVVAFELPPLVRQLIERWGAHHASSFIGRLLAIRIRAVEVAYRRVVGVVSDVIPAVICEVQPQQLAVTSDGVKSVHA